MLNCSYIILSTVTLDGKQQNKIGKFLYGIWFRLGNPLFFVYIYYTLYCTAAFFTVHILNLKIKYEENMMRSNAAYRFSL